MVYDESTIAFVTAAAQTCLLLEHPDEHTREELIEQGYEPCKRCDP